jgi:hypothetical protein
MQWLFKFKSPISKPKLKIFFLDFYFELFSIHINHLTKLPMINIALKWHHKNISNKVTILKKFWPSSNMVLGLFDCDYTHIVVVNHFPPFLSYPCAGVTMTWHDCQCPTQWFSTTMAIMTFINFLHNKFICNNTSWNGFFWGDEWLA